MMHQSTRNSEDVGTPRPVKKAWFISPKSKPESSQVAFRQLMHTPTPTLVACNSNNAKPIDKKKKRRRTVVIRTPYPMRVKMKRSTICALRGDLIGASNSHSQVLLDQTPLRGKKSWNPCSSDVVSVNSGSTTQGSGSRRFRMTIDSHSVAVPIEESEEFISWVTCTQNSKGDGKAGGINEGHRKLMVCNTRFGDDLTLNKVHGTQRYKHEISICDAARRLSCELAHMGRQLKDANDITMSSPYVAPDSSSRQPRRKRVRCKSSISSNLSMTPSDEQTRRTVAKPPCQSTQIKTQPRRSVFSKRQRRISIK